MQKYNKKKILRITVFLLILCLVLQIIIPTFYTKNTGIAPNDNMIKIMSYNIQESSPKILISLLKHLNVDILGLQEVIPNPDENFTQSITQLANELGLNIVEFENYEFNKYGLILLSRYPIIASEFVDYTYIDYAKPRGVQQALLRTPNGDLQVFNTHLNTPNFYTTRIKQIDLLLDRFQTKSKTVLLGDLNTPSYIIDYCYNKLSMEFEDAWVVAGNFHGFGKTIHKNFPILRIDYIFVSSDIGVVKNSASLFENSQISDHKGISVNIALEY